MKLKKWVGFIFMTGFMLLFANCKKSTVIEEPEPPQPVPVTIN